MLSKSGLIIGTHIPFCGSLYKTIIYAIETGMYSFQFFLGSPQSFKRTKLKNQDISKSVSIIDRFPMHIFTHAPYVFNLAKENEDAIISIEEELLSLSLFGGKGVVLHPGSNKNKEEGIINIANKISRINFPISTKLILENMSGQGNMIGSNFEELKYIRDNVDENKRKFVGFCIDTAHIWGMGLYNLSEKEEIDKMFVDIDSILGLENIILFHINDSKANFGSKIDRHQLLCNGEIWGNGKGDSLRYLLNKINELSIPIILETDPSDILKFLY